MSGREGKIRLSFGGEMLVGGGEGEGFKHSEGTKRVNNLFVSENFEKILITLNVEAIQKSVAWHTGSSGLTDYRFEPQYIA